MHLACTDRIEILGVANATSLTIILAVIYWADSSMNVKNLQTATFDMQLICVSSYHIMNDIVHELLCTKEIFLEIHHLRPTFGILSLE